MRTVDRRALTEETAFTQQPLGEAFDDAPGDAAPGVGIGLEVGAVFQGDASFNQILGKQLQITRLAFNRVGRHFAQVGVRLGKEQELDTEHNVFTIGLFS
jgi:hypothetical protein